MATINQINAFKLVDLATGNEVSMEDLISGASAATTAATTTTLGVVKQAAYQADSTATTVAELLADFNTLLASLRTAGLMAAS